MTICVGILVYNVNKFLKLFQVFLSLKQKKIIMY